MYLAFDSETTGLPQWEKPSDDPCQPHLVQVAMIRYDDAFEETGRLYAIVRPDGWEIPEEAAKIHGVTTERALAEGRPLAEVVQEAESLAAGAKLRIGHNISFDVRMIRIACKRLGKEDFLEHIEKFCTMRKTMEICKITKPDGKKGYKWPNLQEAHRIIIGHEFDEAHDALADVLASVAVYRAVSGEVPSLASPAPAEAYQFL